MHLAVGQREAEKQGVGAEHVFEGLHDGNAAAFADEGEFLAGEGFVQRALGRLADGGVRVHAVGLAGVAGFDLQPHAGRCVTLQMIGDLLLDAIGVLTRHESAAQFHEGGASDDSLRAFALITAADAVHFDRGTCPHALACGVAGLAKEGRGAGEREHFRIGITQRGPGFAFPRFEWQHVVVKALHGHFAIRMMQRGGETGSGGDGIHDRAAEEAAVQIDRRSMHDKLQARDAAQAVGEGAGARRDHASVGNGHDIAFQLVRVLLEEGFQIRAADLFFTFDEKDDVHRQIGVRGDGFAQTLQMSHELAFVVRRAAAVNAAIADRGIESGRFPLVERLGGLHVVVAVNQNGAATGLMLVFGQHDRMARRFAQLGGESDAAELADEPFRAGAHIGTLGGVRGDRGKTQAGEQIVESGGIHGAALFKERRDEGKRRAQASARRGFSSKTRVSSAALIPRWFSALSLIRGTVTVLPTKWLPSGERATRSSPIKMSQPASV